MTPKTKAAALKFADAILVIWDINLDLTAIIMQGYRDLLQGEAPSRDPGSSSAKLDLMLAEARRGVASKDIDRAKLQMVRGLLFVWFRIQPHLQNQIFTAVRDLAVVNGVDPNDAINSAHDVIVSARSLDAYFAERQQEMLTKRRQRDVARDQVILDQKSAIRAREGRLSA